jgi:hypothetical protein
MLVELNGNTENILAYVRNSGFSEEKYSALIPEMKLYRQLFKLKYKEEVTDPAILTKMLDLSSNIELTKYAEILDTWITSQKTLDLDLFCPECLLCAVYDDSERGDKVCMACGLVADASYDESIPYDESIDRDLTFQPSSQLSYTGGLGGTLKGTEIHKLLPDNNIDFSEFQQTNPQEASNLVLFGLTAKNDFAYYLSKGFVYRLPIADVSNLFHQLDKPLRKKRLAMIVDSFTNDNKSVLVYAYHLCEKHGIENQAFKNSLGTNVIQGRKILKQFGYSRPRIKPLVDTVFYLTLLDFKKGPEIKRVKPHLQIDYSIGNLIDDHRYFKFVHSKPNYDPSSLNIREAKCLK